MQELCKKCNKEKKPEGLDPTLDGTMFCHCGRPTEYSQELADKICEELALGFSLRTVTKNDWCPPMSTIFNWLRTKKEFLEQYEKAKQESVDAMAEDILYIADDGTNDYEEAERPDGSTFIKLNSENVQRSRLRVDTRKWIMSKIKPKKYGEKIDMTTNGKDIPQPILNVSANNSDTQNTSS